MKTGMGRGFCFYPAVLQDTVTCFEAVSGAGGELAMRKNADLFVQRENHNPNCC